MIQYEEETKKKWGLVKNGFDEKFSMHSLVLQILSSFCSL